MSGELAILVQYCGLGDRWLNILDNVGIQTFDQLQCWVINDGDNLYAELEKEAKDEEKEPLRLMVSKDCIQQVEGVRALKIHLEDNGLDPGRCSTIFTEWGILTLEDLKKIIGNLEMYEELVEGMNHVDTVAIRQMLQIAPEAAAEHEVKGTLNGIGLDSNYWYPIFKDKLGITHPLLFEYISSSDCQILKSNARHEKEVSMIEQFFKTDVPFSTRYQVNKKKCSQRFQEIQRLFSELEELHEERRKEVDKEGNENLDKRKLKVKDLEIKVREEKIKTLLYIPKYKFKDYNNSVLTYEMLKNVMQEGSLQNVLNDSLKDTEVCENASGGLALKGILYLPDKNKAKVRRKLLATPPAFSLSEPSLPHRDCTEQFSSQSQDFLTMLRSNGYSIAVSDRVENQVRDSPKREKYSGSTLVKYIVIPIAAGTFNIDNLSLSEDALKELKKIEEITEASARDDMDQAFKRCEDFFHEFGTHVNTGQIHFGGIYQWRLNYEGKLTGNKEMLMRVANSNMDEFLNSDTENVIPITDNIILTTDTVGGPVNALSFPQWKSELAGDNHSWAIIDRGFNVRGVWELIEHHQQYFNDHGQLAKLLCSTWETKTGLKAGQLPNSKQLVEIPQRIHKLCSCVENWNSDPEISKDYQNYLEFINKEKDHITVISRYPDLWQSVMKENPCILKFLETIVQNKDRLGSNQNIKAIKFTFQQVMRGVKSSSLNGQDAIIIQWLTTTNSLLANQMPVYMDVMLHFMSIVKRYIIPRLNVRDACKNITLSQSTLDGYRISATNDFAAYVSGVLDTLHSLEEHHIASLLTLLLLNLGFDVKSRGCNAWLSDQDLIKLLEDFDEKWKIFMKYREQSVNKVEYYLLYVAIDVIKSSEDNSTIGHKFQQIINHIKLYFSSPVKQMIDKYPNIPDQWKKLESNVQSVLFGTSKEEIQGALGKGLEKVMHVTTVPTEVHEVSQVYTPTITADNKERNDDCNVLEMLGLIEFYPSKITLQHVMLTSENKLNTLKDIPWNVLNQLIMLNYRERNVKCLSGDMTKEEQKSGSETENQDKNEAFDDFEDMFSKYMNSSAETAHTLMPHPLDVLVAIFLCSSNFLRQILAEKMYMCHVSIPVLIPNIQNGKLIYLLWALRNIICECELSDGSIVEASVVGYSLPIVSFIRLGKISRSKSKLLNDVISSHHNTFFHRDCACGIMDQKISEGMADVAWFLPSKRIKSKINEVVTFINLHGNGNLLPKQCSFLSSVSNVVVVMVCIEELQSPKTRSFVKDRIDNGKKLVLIVSKTSHSADENFKQIFRIFMREIGQDLRNQTIIFDFHGNGLKNASEMRNETIDGIIKGLTGEKRFTLEESKKFAESSSIVVDENNTRCSAGQVFAKEVFNYVDRKDLAGTKANMLPLQDLWQKWGTLEKKEHRKEGKVQCSEHYVAKIHEDKQALRHQQLLICNNPPRLFESFLSKLLQLKGTMRLYFLRWLTIYFDETSRKELPSLIKGYSTKWIEINQYKSKQQDKDDPFMMNLHNELFKIEEKLALTSLGLEHMMREVGQAFEAVSSLPEQVTHDLRGNIHQLPRVMAELMLSGYPLEIMDGDASHVPLAWVTAVLSELKMLVGDKNIFVLSILGVQSSGKSTLLNTMFGLQFAVSAGRCTRGVYAQLVPVPKGVSDVTYDYILVVDTEGLRAPELGSTKHQHDNELATLVIGLGDMTIINIKGENPTEMQDVLQIVVHAFLRMQLVNKNLKLQPSCFFIHQNVGAVNASRKNIFGQQKLLNNLDQMTVAAADQENVRGIYSFKEVIDFDVEKNVLYFSDLWQGDPPMAPTNPGYSENVQEVKSSLLNEVMQKKKSRSTLLTIGIRIKDLWKGILAENFVFSFKNSLELKAYDSLETTLTNLSWSLQNDALKWFNDARNRIMSCEKTLDVLEGSLNCEFSTYFVQVYDEAEKVLVMFFENSDDKDTLEQWKERSLLKLHDRKEDTSRTTMNAMKKEFEVRKLELHQINKTETYKEDIQSKAQKLALELQEKENMSEQSLEREFSHMWTKYMESLPSKQLEHQSHDIVTTVMANLYDTFNAYSGLLSKELKKNDLTTPILKLHGSFLINKNDITIKRWYYIFDKATHNHCCEEAYKLISYLFDDIEEYVRSLQGYDFCPTQAVTVIKKTCDAINNVNHSERSFKFTKPFKVRLAVLVCQYAVYKFNEIHQDYLKETDPKTNIERNYREPFLEFFKSIYKKSEKEKMVADMLSTCLMDAINKAVMGDMTRALADDVRQNVVSLHTKGDLLNSIMRDLLKLDCFDEYHLYLNDIKECLKKWVRSYTNDYVFKGRENGISRYAELALLKVKLHLHDICEEIEKATDHVKCVDQDRAHNNVSIIQQWLRVFHEGVTRKLPIPESYLSLVSREQVEDIGFFKENVIKNLTLVQQKLEKKINSVTANQLESEKLSVYDLLERECLGCTAQCPFCRAPCSLTVSEHDVEHSALQHYPQGAGMSRWESNEKLVIDNCSSIVCGNISFRNSETQWSYHPYRDYKTFYPEWKIQADASMEASLYWKRFMAKFASELAEAYKAQLPDIPPAWKSITFAEAEASLN